MKIKIGILHIIIFIILIVSVIYFARVYFIKQADFKLKQVKSRVVKPILGENENTEIVYKNYILEKDIFTSELIDGLELSEEMKGIVKELRNRIRGTMWNSGTGAVLINSGEILEKGDRLGAYEINNISKNGVYIIAENQIVLIKIWED